MADVDDDNGIAEPPRLVCRIPDMNDTVLSLIRTLPANLFAPLIMDICRAEKRAGADWHVETESRW